MVLKVEWPCPINVCAIFASRQGCANPRDDGRAVPIIAVQDGRHCNVGPSRRDLKRGYEFGRFDGHAAVPGRGNLQPVNPYDLPDTRRMALRRRSDYNPWRYNNLLLD